MSRDGVAVVQSGFESFGSEDLFDLLDPEVVWEVRADLPDAAVYRGHDGVRQLYRRFEEVVEDLWFRAEEFIPVGDNQVVVPLRWGGKGKGSGLPFEESQETWVFTVRDARIARVQEFARRSDAFEAMRLSS